MRTTELRTTSSGGKRGRALVAAGSLLFAGGLTGLSTAQPANASSHREAPLIAGLPQYDNTDLYAFTSKDRDSTVTLIANWIPFEDPAGGPNFYTFATDAHYDINIDNNGDAKPDYTYRWIFKNAKTPSPADSFTHNGTFLYNNGPVTSLTDPNLLYRQTYDLHKISYTNGAVMGDETVLKGAPVAPSYVGKASMGTPQQYRQNLRDAAIKNYGPAGTKMARSFAGQAEDPFFLDLRVFDLLYGGDFSEVGKDTLAGYNVNSVALQVPKDDLMSGPRKVDDVVGVWSTTSRRTASGNYAQVSRLGNPLVNEVVIPYQKKDMFNRSQPKDDGQFAKYVLNPELPQVIKAVYKLPAPKAPRNDLVAAFLTGVPGINQPANVVASEQLRLRLNQFNGQTDSRLGVIGGDKNGFPNGRRLTDDVVDIALQVVEGKLIKGHPAAVDTLGDGVNMNDTSFGTTFPYLALPASGSDPKGAMAKNSNVAKHASLLTGGSIGSSGGGTSLPVLPVSLLGTGVLALIAGALITRRGRRFSPLAA